MAQIKKPLQRPVTWLLRKVANDTVAPGLVDFHQPIDGRRDVAWRRLAVDGDGRNEIVNEGLEQSALAAEATNDGPHIDAGGREYPFWLQSYKSLLAIK
ncbi:hypothetical protein [Bradyrhizobium sp. McL0616]|uniref:hypothetical protein n=1 Tax=Bradyrhizobium sp. McL0616 TaxID=3415674 RepID=UPI003CF8E9AA